MLCRPAFLAWSNLPQTGHAYSAVEKRNASAVILRSECQHLIYWRQTLRTLFPVMMLIAEDAVQCVYIRKSVCSISFPRPLTFNFRSFCLFFRWKVLTIDSFFFSLLKPYSLPNGRCSVLFLQLNKVVSYTAHLNAIPDCSIMFFLRNNDIDKSTGYI